MTEQDQPQLTRQTVPLMIQNARRKEHEKNQGCLPTHAASECKQHPKYPFPPSPPPSHKPTHPAPHPARTVQHPYPHQPRGHGRSPPISRRTRCTTVRYRAHHNDMSSQLRTRIWWVHGPMYCFRKAPKRLWFGPGGWGRHDTYITPINGLKKSSIPSMVY